VNWTLQDLLFLREAGVVIDADLFEQVRTEENMHRDFASCSGCGAVTYSQHSSECPRATILFEPLWFELVKDHQP